MRQIYSGLILLAALPGAAAAQRADENAVTAADDAFGTSLGDETIGLYSSSDVRGFSPVAAGNLRLEGLYFSPSPAQNGRLFQGSDIHVGISSLGYPFPAPTGIVDFALRSAGPEPVLSTFVSLGPLAGYRLAIDGQMPISGSLSVAAGIAYRRTVDQPGGDRGSGATIGIAPSWRPSPNVEIRPFGGRSYVIDDIATPYIFVDGAHLPPRFKRRSHAQSWAGWSGHHNDYGVLGSAKIRSWHFRILAFGTSSHFSDSYGDLFLDTDATGLADKHVINIEAPRTSKSQSGEARLTREFRSGQSLHAIHASLRALSQNRNFGGGSSVDFGAAQIGTFTKLTKPDLIFGAQRSEKVNQWSGGLNYVGRLSGVGELSFGLQKTRYRKQSATPDRPELITSAAPWLWNGNLAVHLVRNLAAYAGYTRGLEESAVAPEIAVNRNEAPPAILTSQRDLGFRYAVSSKVRLVFGLFDVRKPYFNLDRNLLYRSLGTTRHKGLETSLTGEVARGLNLVAGAVLMRPRISGTAVDDGLIGSKPVGLASRLIRADIDYRPLGTSPFSVDLSLAYSGEITAHRDGLFAIPPKLLIDAGARYRLKLGRKAVTARLLIENLTDNYDWSVTPSGGFRPGTPRRISTSAAIDF